MNDQIHKVEGYNTTFEKLPSSKTWSRRLRLTSKSHLQFINPTRTIKFPLVLQVRMTEKEQSRISRCSSIHRSDFETWRISRGRDDLGSSTVFRVRGKGFRCPSRSYGRDFLQFSPLYCSFILIFPLNSNTKFSV